MQKVMATAALVFSCVTCCAFLPSVRNKLEVRPVKHVPCMENKNPKSSCGSVTVPPSEAEGFVVTVGWERFMAVTDQNGFTSRVDNTAVVKFSAFAAREVVARGYCKKAVAPTGSDISGTEGSGDRGIYVVCAS